MKVEKIDTMAAEKRLLLTAYHKGSVDCRPGTLSLHIAKGLEEKGLFEFVAMKRDVAVYRLSTTAVDHMYVAAKSQAAMKELNVAQA